MIQNLYLEAFGNPRHIGQGLSVEQPINRLHKQCNPLKTDLETLAMVKSSIWYVLRKKGNMKTTCKLQEQEGQVYSLLQ